MTDIQAAVGREQLRRLPEIIRERRVLGERYGKYLSGVAGLELPHEPDWARSNWQSYCVRLPPGCGQRDVMQIMLDAKISTRRGIMCSHRERPYMDSASGGGQLKCSEEAQDRCILLPLYPGMSESDQVLIAKTLENAIQLVRDDGLSSPRASTLAK
jgi:dTDP-4-amino-4,6-dideoxygalactose transaminase